MRAFLVLLTIVPSLTACEKLGRVHDCRELERVVAEAMDAIEAANKANRPADYRAASKRYLALAQEVRKARFTSAVGQGALEEYALALDSLGPPVAAYADALEKGDKRDLTETRREIDRIGRREYAAAGRLDGYCRSP